MSQLEEDYYERWVPSYVTAIATDGCIGCLDRPYLSPGTDGARVCVRGAAVASCCCSRRCRWRWCR